MKLTFKQKIFAWFGEFNVCDENENVVYKVKGRFALTRTFDILDKDGVKVGRIKRKFINFFTKTYKVYIEGQKVGTIKKLWSLVTPKFKINFNGWDVDGSFFQFNYNVIAEDGSTVATATKKFVAMTDTYELDIVKPEDALGVVLLAVAIDSEKSRRNNG